MMPSQPQTPRLFFLPENEREVARLSGETLQTALTNPPSSVSVEVDHPVSGDRVSVSLPLSVLPILAQALIGLAEGRVIRLFSGDDTLSPQEVAGMMGVSPEYVERLLETGALPSHTMEDETVVSVSHVLDHLKAYREGAEEGLKEMIEEAERLGLYEE